MKQFLFFTSILLCSVFAFAEGTQTWEQSKFEDFEKGTTSGVSIRSDGTLELAPQFKPVYTSPSTYLWAITADAAGNIYAAAGAPARVYRITPDGKAQYIFEPKELQVQALLERKGAVYAATSPDGKIYKLQRAAGPAPANPKAAENWQSSVFFDPTTNYIWALAVDAPGNLYAATGDQGQIFKVTPDGQGAVFFQTDDAHVRSLALDPKGNLIAGTDGSGLIYRITPAGEAFILYSAPKKEITALAVDPAGNIFAAGTGQKRASQPAPTPAPAQPSPTQTPPAQPAPPAQPPAPLNNGSDIYKISADGAPTLLWSSRDSIVYALLNTRLNGKPSLIAGTGNKGNIYAISASGDFSDLVQATANQVTGFAESAGNGVYACTSNLGKVFAIAAAPSAQGTFESDVFDAHLFSKWGRAQLRGSGDVFLETRSGNVENPDRNWSPWTRVDFAGPRAGQIQSPAARFIQWRALLKPGSVPPRVDSVRLNYLSRNVAPVVENVDVQVNGAPPDTSTTPQPGNAAGNPQPQSQPQSNQQGAVHDHTVTVRWNAHDDNDDQLVYRLYYRGDGEANWKPLERDDLTDKNYSFDGGLLPDGGYSIRVVASDSPSHSSDDALTGELASARFEIDTTSPQVQDLHAAVEAATLHVTFRATDSFSAIRRAEYSVDAGDWQFIAPVGEISDSTSENYDFEIPLGAPAPDKKSGPVNPSEHVLAIRTYDRFGNVGSAKLVIK